MKFFEIVICTPWNEVELSFLDYYGRYYNKSKKRIKKKKIKKFKEVYVQLCRIRPKDTGWRIIVNKDKVGDEVYADVSGLNNDPEDDHYYGLGGVSCGEWLGMTITKKSLESFSNSEIAAHCLWELTYYGFPELGHY
jgi:hypothetical protein